MTDNIVTIAIAIAAILLLIVLAFARVQIRASRGRKKREEAAKTRAARREHGTGTAAKRRPNGSGNKPAVTAPKIGGAERPVAKAQPTNGNQGVVVAELMDRATAAGVRLPKSPDKEVASVAKVSPGASVPLAWGPVESAIVDAAKRLGLPDDSEVLQSTFDVIDFLVAKGAVTKNQSGLLHGMRQVRNKAAHNQLPPDALSSADAVLYGRLAQAMASQLQRIS